MNEWQTVHAIRALFPPGPGGPERVPFACDAEVAAFAAGDYALSLDEFSADEDGFPDRDPGQLGANLAVATLADVLAAGATPTHYLHAIVAPRGRHGFAVALARGVAGVLAEGGVAFLGGDLGQAERWRYAGVAIGSRPVPGWTRRLPSEPCRLWVTGRLGDGNRAVLAADAPLRLEPRFREAAALRGVAVAAIDTSGGLADALQTLSRVNPSLAIAIEPAAIPYDDRARAAALERGWPAEAMALGGAGDYEILAAIPEGVSAEDRAAQAGLTRIGRTAPKASGGVYWGARPLPPLPDPRAAPSRDDYIRRIVDLAVHLAAPAEGPA